MCGYLRMYCDIQNGIIYQLCIFWNVALCGASGVCLVFILLSLFTSFREGKISLIVILVTAIYLGQQIYEEIAIKDDISNMTHVLGEL